jgi:hypothetical protein
VAELIRRRPDAAREPVLADQGSWEEFTGTELSHALADTRWAADTMLDLAHTLATKLPGTYAAFRTGILRESKAAIIARAVTNLNPAEARAAEAKVLDRAGKLTPGGLRAAITHAVIEVAPDKARKRRKDAERQARVERWPEPSGNAGLDGDMDQLRARAYMDIILGRDSRPPAGGENRQDSGPDDPSGGPDGGPDDGGSGAPSPDGTGIPPTAARTAAGFAGRTNLTIPLATQLNLADRPGEIPGIGPVETTPGARCTSSEVTVPLPHPAAEARADDLLRGREGVRSRALPYAWRSQPALLKTAAEAAD